MSFKSPFFTFASCVPNCFCMFSSLHFNNSFSNRLFSLIITWFSISTACLNQSSDSFSKNLQLAFISMHKSLQSRYPSPFTVGSSFYAVVIHAALVENCAQNSSKVVSADILLCSLFIRSEVIYLLRA